MPRSSLKLPHHVPPLGARADGRLGQNSGSRPLTGLAMRPIVIAKLFALTLFGLYLAFGLTHATGQRAAPKGLRDWPEQPNRHSRKRRNIMRRFQTYLSGSSPSQSVRATHAGPQQLRELIALGGAEVGHPLLV